MDTRPPARFLSTLVFTSSPSPFTSAATPSTHRVSPYFSSYIYEKSLICIPYTDLLII